MPQSKQTTRSVWLSVAEAAQRLNLSDTTVRRRVKADELGSRRTGDGRIEVRLDGAAGPRAWAAAATSATQPPAAAMPGTPPPDPSPGPTPGPNPAELNHQLTRFQQMAGATITLAQHQTDEANEKLAIVRFELDRARSVTRWAIGVAAVALVLTVWSLARAGASQVDGASAQGQVKATLQTARVE